MLWWEHLLGIGAVVFCLAVVVASAGIIFAPMGDPKLDSFWDE